MVRINGVEKDITAHTSLEDLLKAEGYRLDVIAVQLNGDIVPRDRYAATALADLDAIEVVSFVGGGCA